MRGMDIGRILSGCKRRAGVLRGAAASALLALHPYRTVRVGGRALKLDLRWQHERMYHSFCASGAFFPSVEIDVLCARRLVNQGDIVLDAGANVGFTTLLFCEAGASHVHAIEPDPALYARLQALQSDLIQVYPFAVGDSDGTADLFVSTEHNQGGTANPLMVEKFRSVFGEALKTVPVTTRTLDSLFSDVAFDVMKIDVEGNELLLLKGATEVLSRHTPRVVMIEIYEDFFDEVHGELGNYYQFARRACVHVPTRTLRFLETGEVGGVDTKTHALGPPFYVYVNDEAAYHA